jgi:hypothetical protein
MSLNSLLTELIVRPAPAQRASRLLDAMVWRLLMGFAVLFLILAAWRALEMAVGPILAPLIMAAALSLAAAAFALLESRRKRKLQQTTPSVAPLIATLLEIAFAPKLVRWFALGNLLLDVASGKSPLSPKSVRKRRAAAE